MSIEKQDYLRIFLGSPSDVTSEREIAYRVINDVENILRIFKDYLLFNIPPLRAIGWEQVPPDIGLPNEIIIDKFPIDQSDIFIFILWKRFGTPPGTHRSDGSKYSSGTQEEFEKALLCNRQGTSGRPFIMVYQKKDEFNTASMRPKEIGQYNKVAQFFEDCAPSGKHPVLTYSFLAKDFESLLRQHLLNSLLRLTKKHEEELPQEENTQLIEWLEKNNLVSNPFRHIMAEQEENLIKYYVPIKSLSLYVNDITKDDNCWFIFGREGSGKTALMRFLSARCAPKKEISKDFCIQYGKDEFQKALSFSDDPNKIALYFAHQICELAGESQIAVKSKKSEILSSNDPKTILQNLQNTLGFDRLLCLIDPNPMEDNIDSKINISNLAKIIARIAALTPKNVGLRIFLPKELQADLMKQKIYLGKYNYLEIRWDEKDLRELIKQRMIYFSKNKLSPNQSIGPLCEPKGNMGSIDDGIIKLSEGNPRAVIWLANQLFLEHCQHEFVPLKIESRTWDKVQLNWWETGQRFVLGSFGKSESFSTIGNDVYFMDNLLELSKRSKILLKYLVDSDGQICSRDVLISTAWPDANKDGVTESALREAMRRLKVELRAKNSIDSRWVKTVHNQGYQLQEPENGLIDQED